MGNVGNVNAENIVLAVTANRNGIVKILCIRAVKGKYKLPSQINAPGKSALRTSRG